jgi:hypothetical protein
MKKLGTVAKVLLCLDRVLKLSHSYFAEKGTSLVFIRSELGTQFIFVIPAFLLGGGGVTEMRFFDCWRFAVEKVEKAVVRL